MDIIIAAWSFVTLLIIALAWIADHNARKLAEKRFTQHVNQALNLANKDLTNH